MGYFLSSSFVVILISEAVKKQKKLNHPVPPYQPPCSAGENPKETENCSLKSKEMLALSSHHSTVAVDVKCPCFSSLNFRRCHLNCCGRQQPPSRAIVCCSSTIPSPRRRLQTARSRRLAKEVFCEVLKKVVKLLVGVAIAVAVSNYLRENVDKLIAVKKLNKKLGSFEEFKTLLGLFALGGGVVDFLWKKLLPGEEEEKFLNAISSQPPSNLDLSRKYLWNQGWRLPLSKTEVGKLMELEPEGKKEEIEEDVVVLASLHQEMMEAYNRYLALVDKYQ